MVDSTRPACRGAEEMFDTVGDSILILPQIRSNINLIMPFLASDSLSTLDGSWSITFPDGKEGKVGAVSGGSFGRFL